MWLKERVLVFHPYNNLFPSSGQPMYINSSSFKSMSTNRNSLKLDILQLIRLCRERSGDNTERIQDIINRSQKKIYRKHKYSEKVISDSMKSEEYKHQLPKLTNRSLEKVKREPKGTANKDYQGKQHETPKKKVIRSLHKYKLSTERVEDVVLPISKLSYAGSLPNQHFSKKKRMYTQVHASSEAHHQPHFLFAPSNFNQESNPELKTLPPLPLPSAPLNSPTFDYSSPIRQASHHHQPNSIDSVYYHPSNLSHSASRQLHRQIPYKVPKHRKEMNLITNNGWKVEMNQYQSIYE